MRRLGSSIEREVVLSSKKYSIWNILKALFNLSPILIFCAQFLIISVIINDYSSPFNSGTIVLFVSVLTQLPCLVIFRKLTNMELTLSFYVPIVAMTIIDPLINLILLNCAQVGILDYTKPVFLTLIITTNVIMQMILIGLLWWKKKRLYSLYKVFMSSSLAAIISQFAIFASVTLELTKTSFLDYSDNFSSRELIIFILSVFWFVGVAILIEVGIRYFTRHINIFNKVSRYDLSGLFPIPISITTLGAFNLLLLKSEFDSYKVFFTAQSFTFYIAVGTMAAMIAIAIVIVFGSLKFGLNPSMLKVLIICVAVVNLAICGLLFVSSEDRVIVGIGMILVGLSGIIMHLIVSGLSKLNSRAEKLNVFIEINYFFTILCIGAFVILILLRYDIKIANALFAPNLIFIIMEMVLLSFILVEQLKFKSSLVFARREK